VRISRPAREEFLAGCREISPVLLGSMPFGFVTGVAAASAGLTPLEGIALSMLAFSGIAQLVVSQLIASQAPIAVAIAAAFVVSLRLMMYSASLSPYLAHLDLRWRALLSFLMTDQSFAMTVRRYGDSGDRGLLHWHFLGNAVTLYVSWQTAVILGIFTGAQVPASWSLDFAVVLTFLAILVPAVRRRADLAAAIVSAGAALVFAGLPYRLALVVASLAGIVVGLVLDRERPS
jgi:predicted branched-subunit amino acid permease